MPNTHCNCCGPTCPDVNIEKRLLKSNEIVSFLADDTKDNGLNGVNSPYVRPVAQRGTNYASIEEKINGSFFVQENRTGAGNPPAGINYREDRSYNNATWKKTYPTPIDTCDTGFLSTGSGGWQIQTQTYQQSFFPIEYFLKEDKTNEFFWLGDGVAHPDDPSVIGTNEQPWGITTTTIEKISPADPPTTTTTYGKTGNFPDTTSAGRGVVNEDFINTPTKFTNEATHQIPSNTTLFTYAGDNGTVTYTEEMLDALSNQDILDAGESCSLTQDASSGSTGLINLTLSEVPELDDDGDPTGGGTGVFYPTDIDFFILQYRIQVQDDHDPPPLPEDQKWFGTYLRAQVIETWTPEGGTPIEQVKDVIWTGPGTLGDDESWKTDWQSFDYPDTPIEEGQMQVILKRWQCYNGGKWFD